MDKKFPVGVIIAAVLMFIFALFSTAVIWFMYVSSGRNPDATAHFYFVFWGLPAFLFVLCGISLLRLRNWARTLVVFISAIIVIIEGFFGILFLFFGKQDSCGLGTAYYLFFILPALFPALFFLIYFTRAKVKECYK